MATRGATFSTRSDIGLGHNAFAEALSAVRGAGTRLIDLTTSNPSEVGLGWPAATLAALLDSPELGSYVPEPFGLWSAREAIANELACRGLDVAATHIMLTASTSEAYAFLFKLLCDPGDSVLVPEPSYPLFEVLARLEGVQLIPYCLAYDGTWHLDRASVEHALAQAERMPRALVTVHPNNPTGSFLTRDELRYVTSLGLPVISDEVFGEYALVAVPERAESALEAAPQTLIFRLSGLSKSLALPQLKLAFTAISGPSALVEAACKRLEHIADAFLSVGSPVQLALPQLLRHGPSVRAGIASRVRENRTVLGRALAHSAASLLHSEGGWSAIVRVPAILSDEAWSLSLLAEGVVVQPGYFFDLRDGVYLVLSCLPEPRLFAEGASRMRALLDRYVGP